MHFEVSHSVKYFIHLTRLRIRATRKKTIVNINQVACVTQIDVITKLIRCAEIAHQHRYKVLITIDDLDRIPLTKVQQVQQA